MHPCTTNYSRPSFFSSLASRTFVFSFGYENKPSRFDFHISPFLHGWRTGYGLIHSRLISPFDLLTPHARSFPSPHTSTLSHVPCERVQHHHHRIAIDISQSKMSLFLCRAFELPLFSASSSNHFAHPIFFVLVQFTVYARRLALFSRTLTFLRILLSLQYVP